MGTYIIDMISDKATISQIFSALVAALVAALILYLVKKSTNLLNTTDIAYSRVNLCKIRKKIDEKTYSATFISYFMKNEGKKIARNIQILIDVEPQNISINPEISFTTRKNPDGKFVIIIPHIDGGDSIILNFSEMISSSVVSSLLLFEIRSVTYDGGFGRSAQKSIVLSKAPNQELITNLFKYTFRSAIFSFLVIACYKILGILLK